MLCYLRAASPKATAVHREVVDSLKASGAAQLYAGAMSAPSAAQILAALHLIQVGTGVSTQHAM